MRKPTPERWTREPGACKSAAESRTAKSMANTGAAETMSAKFLRVSARRECTSC
jgi:hypothetical protein